MAIPFIKETVVYQLSKRFYQLPKSVDSEKKTKGKKSVPTKKLVTQRQSSPQPRINPAFRQKVRKADALVNFGANYIRKNVRTRG